VLCLPVQRYVYVLLAVRVLCNVLAGHLGPFSAACATFSFFSFTSLLSISHVLRCFFSWVWSPLVFYVLAQGNETQFLGVPAMFRIWTVLLPLSGADCGSTVSYCAVAV
jgi:hypothetical protein